MRGNLKYLLLDGFDPDLGELALRVALHAEEGSAPNLLRIKLFLGHAGDAIQPLRRELQTHVQMAIPMLWDKGLKIIIRAIEDELETPQGRNPQRYAWVQTQILHPADERRSTINHAVPRQVEILWDWAQHLEQEGDTVRTLELLERLLLLAPQHAPALSWLASLLRQQGMVEEMLQIVDRLLKLQPDNIEVRLRRGEALLYLERSTEALDLFISILKTNPVHTLAHLGAAQARSHAGGDACPHLDAALELDREATLSVLKETFDFRVLLPVPGERVYTTEELPALLGIMNSEIHSFTERHGMPLRKNRIRESELSRWVLIQNRYHLLPVGLHWQAPTPKKLSEIH